MTTCILCCILERNQVGERKNLSVVSASLLLIIIITNLTTAVQLSGTAAARNFGNKDHLLLRNFYSPLPDFLFHSRKYGDRRSLDEVMYWNPIKRRHRVVLLLLPPGPWKLQVLEGGSCWVRKRAARSFKCQSSPRAADESRAPGQWIVHLSGWEQRVQFYIHRHGYV